MSHLASLIILLSCLIPTISATWFCSSSASVYVCGFANACNYQMVFGNGMNDNQFLAQQQAKTACETSARIKAPSSAPVCVTSCSPSSSGSQTQAPNQPSTPTSTPTPTPTPAPFQCREGTNHPSSTGELEPDSSSWSISTCQSDQHFCVTYFDQSEDQRLIMSNCADSCTPGVDVTANNTWVETTCCSTSNCNNDLTKMSQYDWTSARTQNITGAPATIAPTTTPSTCHGLFCSGASATTSSITVMMIFNSLCLLFMM